MYLCLFGLERRRLSQRHVDVTVAFTRSAARAANLAMARVSTHNLRKIWIRSSMQHQPRMLKNARLSKQQISTYIGTVSWQEVILILTITVPPTRYPTMAMTCETKWTSLWLCAIDVGYTITGSVVRLQHVESPRT